MSAPLDVTVVILAFNEALHIERCVSRIAPHVRRVVVVDSHSTDDTVDRARAAGAEVIANRFVNQGQQFNWALDQLDITTGWILRLDSDEYLDDAALDWLRQNLAALPPGTAGVEFRLKVVFKGKHLRHGGYYSTYLLRAWRTGRGRLEQRWMDERTLIDGGTARASGNLIDENLNTIGWWTDKHNRYASRQAIDFILLENRVGEVADAAAGTRLNAQARFKRFLRNRVYARFPLFVRPVLYWLLHYFVLLGFLDGRRGLIWHFLHGFWYFVLIDAKIGEARAIVARGGLRALADHYHRRYAISLELPDAIRGSGVGAPGPAAGSDPADIDARVSTINRETTLAMARAMQAPARRGAWTLLRPFAGFFRRYVLLGGFLGGKAGFVSCFFDGLWRNFLTEVKIDEASRVLAHDGPEGLRRWLSQAYGVEGTAA